MEKWQLFLKSKYFVHSNLGHLAMASLSISGVGELSGPQSSSESDLDSLPDSELVEWSERVNVNMSDCLRERKRRMVAKTKKIRLSLRFW